MDSAAVRSSTRRSQLLAIRQLGSLLRKYRRVMPTVSATAAPGHRGIRVADTSLDMMRRSGGPSPGLHGWSISIFGETRRQIAASRQALEGRRLQKVASTRCGAGVMVADNGWAITSAAVQPACVRPPGSCR